MVTRRAHQATVDALPDLGGPALRAYFAIARAWGLKNAEARRLLGDPPESTWYKWKKQQDGNPGRDVLERISYVLGIFKALQVLFPDPTRADAWLRKPNAALPFGGGSALERMLAEEGAVQPAGDPGESEGSGVSLPIAIASHPDHGERIRFFREWQAPGP